MLLLRELNQAMKSRIEVRSRTRYQLIIESKLSIETIYLKIQFKIQPEYTIDKITKIKKNLRISATRWSKSDFQSIN
jgi:hypothetical protein